MEWTPLLLVDDAMDTISLEFSMTSLLSQAPGFTRQLGLDWSEIGSSDASTKESGSSRRALPQLLIMPHGVGSAGLWALLVWARAHAPKDCLAWVTERTVGFH